MAGPYAHSAIILLPDGSTGSLNLYAAASAAVNTYLPVSKSQKALATDLTEFTPKVNARIVDFVNEDALSVLGQVQIEENGDRKGVFISVPMHAATNAGRPRLGIALRAGSKYRFVITSIFSA